MKCIVLPPFRVAKDGVVWRPGDVAEVDDATAENWARYGYVKLLPEPEQQHQPAKPKPERKPKPETEPEQASDHG